MLSFTFAFPEKTLEVEVLGKYELNFYFPNTVFDIQHN